MGEDKYERLAKEVKGLFERELGKFSLEDFNEVIKVVRTESFGARLNYYEAYEKASEEERDQIDFMMKL